MYEVAGVYSGLILISLLADKFILKRQFQVEPSKAQKAYLEMNDGSDSGLKCKHCGTPMIPNMTVCIWCSKN